MNEPSSPAMDWTLYREHLLTASNELYLLELLCRQHGVETPSRVRRAHTALRAEIRRLGRVGEGAP